jgi:hypothetical protein
MIRVGRPFDSWHNLIAPFEAHKAQAYADICRTCLRDPVWADCSTPLPVLHAVRSASFAGRATDPFGGDGTAFCDDLGALTDEVQAASDRGLVQLTEPLRVADLLPGLLLASRWAGDRPLRLVELGSSVGFLLVPERFRIRYPRAVWDPPGALCELVSDLDVPAPLHEQPLTIADRVGVDLAPVDATDSGAYDYLRAFCWPGDPTREQRLAEALPTVRHDPPVILTADALEVLPDLVPRDRDVVTVVVESALSAYLSGRQAMRLGQTLDRLAGRTTLMLLTRAQQRGEEVLTSNMTLVDLTRRRRLTYALSDMLCERSRWVA